MIELWTFLFPMEGKIIGWRMYDKRIPAEREFSQFPELSVKRGQQFEWQTYGRYAWVKAILMTDSGRIEVEFKCPPLSPLPS